MESQRKFKGSRFRNQYCSSWRSLSIKRGLGCRWYHSDDETEKYWREDPTNWYNNYFVYGLEQIERIRKAAYDPSVKVSDVFPANQSDEPMIPLIEALACDVERIVIVNIPNEGEFVPGVPKDFEVEVPALISTRGIQGIRTTPKCLHLNCLDLAFFLALLYFSLLFPFHQMDYKGKSSIHLLYILY